MISASRDRFGLLMRPAFAREIRERMNRIDLLQLIADDWLGAPAPWLSAVRVLAADVPVHLHGVGLGLASVTRVDPTRLDEIARLVGALRPQRWSEHLAFMREDGTAIRQLAAPPRTPSTIEGTVRNVERARQVVGSAPELENVATPIDPPGSELTEPEWLRGVLWASGAPMLLDLHNLYCNAVSLGFDPVEALIDLPLDRVCTLHVAGGRKVRAPSGVERILDDHAHPVPWEVHELLYEFGRRTEHAVDVILEREARVPPLEVLLDELHELRGTLAKGRNDARMGIAS